jgi:hypothetical protein
VTNLKGLGHFLLDREFLPAQTWRSRMTVLAKKNIKLLGIIFFFGIVAFGGCVFLTLPRPPKEDKLIQIFNDHRTAFEQLRDMLQADTNLCRVARWGVETRRPFFLGYPSEANFPTNRFQQYLALLKQANGYVGVRSGGDHADVGIAVWGWGFAGNTRHIWIYWVNETPTNHERVAFKQIDHSWYLVRDW